MRQLTCEMCGGTDLVKQDGVFVCQSCGTKYSIEEAKKMMVEGTVDVSGSTIKVDTSNELKNLYQIARRAKDDNNSENAAKYYDMILVKDPTSWEASFYVVYFKAMECKIAHIRSASISVTNCIESVLGLIKDYVGNKEDQIKAVMEVVLRCTLISDMLYNGAKDHYNDINYQIRDNYTQEMVSNCFAAMEIMYTLGNHIDSLFGDFEELHSVAVTSWEIGITRHNGLMGYLTQKEANKGIIMEYAAKIQKYKNDYQPPTMNTNTGCYIATAVYGSYDCPEVWTLRRYRDYILAETWYGRTFIRTYYTISPTLVKWFGDTEWFKKLWKGKLDRMVADLKKKGFKDTPYEDRNWQWYGRENEQSAN